MSIIKCRLGLSQKPLVGRVKTVLFFCVILTFGIHFAAAQKYHINTIRCGIDQDDLARLNRVAGFEAKFYNTVFNTTKNDSLAVVVNLYGRRSQFDAINKVPNSTFFDGFYSPQTDRIDAVKKNGYINILLHETSHAFLEHNYPRPPRWINGGLAMLFQNPTVQNNAVFFSREDMRIKVVKDMLYAHTFSLSDFFKSPDSNWYTEKTEVDHMYGISYCLVYYLAIYDMESLSNILILMKNGYSSLNAITKVFGSFDRFEKRFLDFYKPEIGYRP